MKKVTYLLALLLFTASACEVEKQQSGDLPEVEVDVDAEEGEMPEYKVNWADVNVGRRTKTVEVPKVMVVMEEKEVEVPYIDVQMEGEEGVERTIKVEAQVTETMHELDIKKVYAMENKLIVISSIEDEGEPLEDKTVRISDQVILNAPEDLMVRHYIVGEKPAGSFNNNYKYIASEDEISSMTNNATLLFE